jgi:hypothetical protein
MNLNSKQIIAIIGAIISVLMVSSAQLTDLIGAGWAKYIVTIAGLANMILQSVTVALTTQTAQIKDVTAMPGVAKVLFNEQATPAAAAIATDPTQPKAAATTPEVRATLIQTAKGA